MNYQSWVGCEDPKFGYGAMLDGFRSAIPKTVAFDNHASVRVYMSVPYTERGWYKEQHSVLFTMWETDTLPDNFVRWLPLYDQILVPCKHNLDLFQIHHPNVSMVPLGIDNKFWKPLRKETNPVFRFHAGGSLWFRKGLDIVVRAFNELALPDAELHIKAAPHARDTPTGRLGDNIHVYRNWMTLEEQRAWFNQADCFIAASRGEGFGLMPLQAIALAIPTIVSTSTGQEQFAHLATGTVDCAKSPAHTIGNWDEPDLDQLKEQMLHHYRNRDEVQEQADLNAPQTKQFSWANATKQLLAAIPTGTLLESPTYQSVEPEVQIQVNKKVTADIGKHHYKLEPGRTYTVPENVLHVLTDAGYIC